jgi:triacylglycerol lipase
MNIVLVHGILGFRNLVQVGPTGLIPYFRDVAAHFNAQGHRVLPVELDKTAGVAVRAGQLGDQIAAGLGAGGPLDPALKTHIIAHSMGGLDSRYLLSPANPKPNNLPIRSLTTIGTPHRGSPIADAVDNDHIPQRVKDAISAVLAKFEISLDGLRDLRTDRCMKFSATHPDRPGVDYSCIGGVGRPGLIIKTWKLFVPLHEFISLQTHEVNDGLVTLSSSQWGTPVEQWPADHVDEVGYSLPDIPPVFDHLPKYDEILARLVALA